MSAGKARARILLVEDEAVIALAEKRMLAAAGYSVAVAPGGEEAVAAAEAGDYDLVLMDIDLGSGMNGGTAARKIRENGGPPVVFLSSHSEETAIAKTRGSGAYGFIQKGSPERVLLASVRMALELASALSTLADSESRWASLARSVAEYIVSIGRDGRIVFSNRPLGGEGGLGPGDAFADFVRDQDRAAVDQAIARVFSNGYFARQLLHARGIGGKSAAYDVLFGPGGAHRDFDTLTAVLRDADLAGEWPEADLEAMGDREAAVAQAVSSFSFAPLHGLIEGFHAVTGLQVSVIRGEERFLASTPFSRACSDFHRASPASLAACKAAGGIAHAAEPGTGAFFEHLCPNGLRDISMPLRIECIRWGTIFVGQFLYEDDELREEDLARRAAENGWDLEDYRAAMREIPRVSRDRMESILLFFRSIADAASALAASAYRERMLEKRLGGVGIAR